MSLIKEHVAWSLGKLATTMKRQIASIIIIMLSPFLYYGIRRVAVKITLRPNIGMVHIAKYKYK